MCKKSIFVGAICLNVLFHISYIATGYDPIAIAEGRSLKEVFKRVNPSVVVILTKEGGYSKSIPNMPIVRTGLGSGIAVSKDGHIMTAAHVVQAADEVYVRFLDGIQVPARVVSAAQQADVAMVKLEDLPDNLPIAELGDSDLAETGDEVFVVGAPYGIEHTLTVGHISGRRKTVGICNELTPIEFLQTDAGINIGNSGGPLFSIDGKLIGIVSHILSKSGGSEGLGFAVSINTAKALLIDRETFWTGLDAYLLSGELAKALNVPQEAGLLIQHVAVDSFAHRLGLRPSRVPIQIGDSEIFIGGDILLEVQGIPVSSSIQETCRIRDKMGGVERGGYMEVKVLREGRVINLRAAK